VVTGVNLLWIFFFFPETLYVRNYDTGLSFINVSALARVTTEEETGSATLKAQETEKVRTETALCSKLKKSESFLQQLQLKPWSPINPSNTNLLLLFFRPWPMILYPTLIFSFISFATVLGWPICVINTNASIYQLPPYNMSPGINNLINLPSFIGSVVGAYVGGAFSDWLAERSARRNNGIFEPESRLTALIPSFFIVPIGLLMYSSHSLSHFVALAVLMVGTGLLRNDSCTQQLASLDTVSSASALALFPPSP